METYWSNVVKHYHQHPVPNSKLKTSSGLFNLKRTWRRFVQMTIKNYQSPEPQELDTSSATSVFSSLWRMAQNTFTEKAKKNLLWMRNWDNLEHITCFKTFPCIFFGSYKLEIRKWNGKNNEKKKPFQNVNVDLIYINWEQLNATNGESIEGSKVSTKHPILSKTSPISHEWKSFHWIWNSSNKRTWCSFHGPFHSTVERESIDFVWQLFEDLECWTCSADRETL